jgi:ribosomal protein L37AE/L43A
LKRTSVTHHKRPQIMESHRRFKSGFNGEQSLRYFYRYLPREGVHFIPGIRILHDEYYFQMDLLFITPHFLLILEIKNHAGLLYFDDKVKQMIRTLDGKRECFDDPIEQVNRQKYHLSKVMEQYKLPAVPIETLVVITNPSTIVEFSSTYKEAFVRVIKSPQLQQKFSEFQQKYQNPIQNTKEMRKFIKLLFKLHDAYDPDVCELFQINKNELTKGVFCPKCDQPSIMQYTRANWRCANCEHKSKKAHVEALKDYALLISPTITNQECKSYLNLPSTSITTHLLKALNLPHEGSTKSRCYNLLPLLDSK